MSNPLINQGSLNRLLGSVIIPALPYLTVTAPFLAKEGISIALEGAASDLHPTMTGGVPSPAPYQFAQITIHVLKTNALGQAYKTQFETNTTLGNVAVTTDTVALLPYNFDTCVLESVDPITLAGDIPGMAVKIRGIYRINSAAFFGS
jgi:hypothetical protein